MSRREAALILGVRYVRLLDLMLIEKLLSRIRYLQHIEKPCSTIIQTMAAQLT